MNKVHFFHWHAEACHDYYLAKPFFCLEPYKLNITRAECTNTIQGKPFQAFELLHLINYYMEYTIKVDSSKMTIKGFESQQNVSVQFIK